MTDNFEDLEHHDNEHMEEQPPKTGFKANLGEAWRTRPLFKLLVVMVGAGAVIALAANLFTSTPKEQQSRLVNPPDVHETPGGKTSPYFLEQTKKAEQTRENEALKRGQSALPTPIGRDNGMNAEDKGDPLTDLRAETMRLRQQMTAMQAQQQTQQQPGQNQQQERFDESLAQAMQQQMRQFMDSWAPKGIKDISVSKEDVAAGTGTNGQGAAGANGSANASPQSPTPAPKVILTAGTVSYAQLLVEANSDVPGPILAQIVSGPLSGARAVGAFQIANGYNDYLVLHFTHANFKGKDYAIDAYALDPDTTLAGLATEVDQRYFTRVILPAAAGFLQGLGGAIGQSNQTTTVTNGLSIVSQPKVGIDQGIAQGLGQAAGVASQFFQNQANQTRPLVRVATGTPMGMFFISSVVDQQYTPPLPGTNTANGMGYPGMNGVPGMGGYPGMNYPGAGGYGLNPGATNAGYGGYPQTGNSSVPYPNVGMPSTGYGGYGGGYGGYGSNGLRTYQSTPGYYPGQGLVP